MAKIQWPPRRKNKLVVDACNPGNPDCQDGPTGKKKHKTEQPKPEPQSGRHMNVRDLNSDPGEVRMQKDNSSSALTATQEQRGRANETAIGKVKLAFKRKKKE